MFRPQRILVWLLSPAGFQLYGRDMMRYTKKARVISKAVLTRAVLLGLGLSTVFTGGGLAFADDASLSGNTTIIDQDTSSKKVVGIGFNYVSSLTAEKNRLTITGSTVGETKEIYYKSNADSQAVIADNKATITDTTVAGNYYGIYKENRDGNLSRTGNHTSFQDSTVTGWVMGNYISENLEDLTSQNNIISLTDKSKVDSWLVQDFAYGKQGKFTNNQIILDDSKVLGPIRGEKFIALKSDAPITAVKSIFVCKIPLGT